ncbi:GNAT family N-acetyltransferase [Halogeometricum sp. S1BR25-6]|uniref:GNAT family N-acetyltransferase n=1 Tax=Halogeometricum salsisoli TaxID=2950536 RepID=A0ABU2GAG1_9EURY|nr:GNAT family N-acetyltransferase [Halogeometricum sp. S1BR25-6]MDS0297780.1 GNAT family N-acetyltransferase [Halogeometricum sp. S1BR25-6]
MTLVDQQPPTKSSSPNEEDRHPTLSDFLVKTVDKESDRLGQLNDFFNSPQIKSELHWFTHRDTLERAAVRNDRKLYYYRPFDEILGGLMVWCESRVLEDHQAQIRLVAVHPAYREYGIGRYLVKSAIKFAKVWEKSTMIADVAADASAVGFWKACGFHQVDQYQTKGGREMYQMQRRIN